MKTTLALLFAAAVGALSPNARADDTHVLKIATLAPEGSMWMNLFHEWARDVESHTGGAVKIKFYSGGVAGDERDCVRKMRMGQLGGAAVTSVGLGLIQPEVRVLEVPLLISSYDELDYVRGTLDAELRAKFDEKGFVLLGWGDVGPIQIFSTQPVRSRADLAKTKLWQWADDPISKVMFDTLGLRGVPLGPPDVLPSLSTGMVDTVLGSPLAVLALQWHTRLRYVTRMRFGQAIGATVVTRAQFDKLTEAQRQIVLADARVLERKLLTQVRGENDRALAAMVKQGFTVVDAAPELGRELESLAKPMRDALEPRLYSHAFRARVEKLVADYRASKTARR